MQKLGKLEEIQDLRQIWPHEAHDFTPWLAQEENIALLGEAIGLEMTVEETESSVGGFSVDIYASETETGRRIVIENQLEDTNHDHLGKLITYASGKSAEVLIWIVRRAREEHRAAIEWLNRHTDERVGFFLCEVKIYRIGDSDPAVKFEVIEEPNDWAKEIRQTDSMTETKQRLYEYWVAFLEDAYKDRLFCSMFRRNKPVPRHVMDFGIGSPRYHLIVHQRRKHHDLEVGLYVREKELFYSLLDHRDEIERESKLTFDWQELPDQKASKIVIRKNVDFEMRSQWGAQFAWSIDVLMRMKNILPKYLD